MIRAALLTILFTSMATLSAAPSDIGLLPQDKKPVVVSDSEPNPFGKRTQQAPSEVVLVVESEETRLRGAIQSLPLGGMTRGYGVTKVLLGSHMVAAGQILPDLISGQTERLKVVSVSDDEVELGFMEENGTIGDRKILLAIDLVPVVRYKLRGHSPSVSGEGDIKFDGVLKDHGSKLPTD
jgi:hypothetical protein